jgi:hypothetical protein
LLSNIKKKVEFVDKIKWEIVNSLKKKKKTL